MNVADRRAAEGINDLVLRDVHYPEEGGSLEFDQYLREHRHSSAPNTVRGFSKVTPDVVVSGWHQPCFAIVLLTRECLAQAFHVQGSTTWDQDEQLRARALEGARAIPLHGNCGCYSVVEARNLQRKGITVERTIPVETDDRWRVLYDPSPNEFWIDDLKNRRLIVYRGFTQK